MGILHSSCRFFGCKTANEEEEWPIYPYPLHYHYNGGSEGFSSACSSILECFGLARGRRRAENDVVPIQNRSSREPLLVSVSDKGRSQSSYQPEKKQRDHPDVGITRTTYKSSPTGKDAPRNVPTSSSSSSSTVTVRKDAPRNVPMKKADREEEKKATVSVRKDVPRNFGMKKAEREEEEKKELASSSIVSVGKDAPRYVRILKADREDVIRNVSTSSSTISDVTRNVPTSSFSSTAPRNVPIKKADGEEKKLPSSTVCVRKDAPRNVPIKKAADREEEKKKLASSSIVSIGRDAPRYVRILGTKKADRDEEVKKVSCKELSSVSVAPRNVPFLEERMSKKKTDPEEENKSLIMEERWIQHYSSRHRILLVGEGDFSFSASLALAFSSASNIIATSLNSREFLLKNYFRAASNIEKLRSRKSQVMHEIDATKMADDPSLRHLKFDRIIFNFPYAGLYLKILPRESQLRSHRRLVDMFLKNAREMINEDGEIHITHKTNHFHTEFNLQSIASSHNLSLIEAVDFNNRDYPGYNTKCGFGGNNNFNCNPSKTYKFGIKKFKRFCCSHHEEMYRLYM